MTTVALSLRIVTAVRDGALLARRPSSKVVHLVRATKTTPSGRFIPRAVRTVCHCRTGRLHTFGADLSTVPTAGLRFCRRCTAALPPCGAAVQQLRTRADDQQAFGHLTIDDFVTAARWCRTVEETHQVGRIANVVHGPAPLLQPTPSSPFTDRWALEQILLARRDALRYAELTPEEREDLAAAKEAQTRHAAAMAESHRRGQAVARAQDRARRGQYLMPHQRDLLDKSITRGA